MFYGPAHPSQKLFLEFEEEDQLKLFLVSFPPINYFSRWKVEQQISTTYPVLNFISSPPPPPPFKEVLRRENQGLKVYPVDRS